MLQWLGRVWRAMLASLLALLRGTSGTTLTLTGVLGLAAVIYVLHHLRAGQGRKPDGPDAARSLQQPADPGAPSTSAAAAAVASPAIAVARAASAAPAAAAAATLAAAMARRLAGVRRVTLSVPGVVLEEAGAEELDEGATVRPGVAALVREIARTADLYLLCQVHDDIGEALVRGALEHAGIVGAGPGQVPPHRLLFCGSLPGKVAIARQLDSELHIDAHPQTVTDLQRFVKRLVLVGGAPGHAAAAGSSAGSLAAANVQHAPSLAAALGLPSS